MRKIFILTAFSFFAQVAYSQNTFTQVYNILKTNCSGSGCHGGSLPGFNVNLSEQDVYNAIVEVDPLNPTALQRGEKLIDPGYPTRSFLLKKVANCISGDLALVQGDGSPMPDRRAPLQNEEIELIRQWILYGAPISGRAIDENIINTYYTQGGRPRMPKPAEPLSCEGFQLHMGPLFFKPNEEKEYFLKFDLNLDDDIEVTRLQLIMNNESHHFILRKFRPGTKDNWPDGLELLNPLTAFDGDKDYIMAWQANEDISLPNGTAYIWEAGSALDLNFHMFNYYNEILIGDVYLNVYTQPKGTAEKEMVASLINNPALFIAASPNGLGNPQTFTQNVNLSNVSLWSLSSHTHRLGVDYKIWLKGPNNEQKDLIFDGFVDYNTNTNKGFYEWEHPPIRFFEPFLFVDPAQYTGFIHRATYRNDQNRVVTFGFTTRDEMMIFYVQYVAGTYNIPPIRTYTPDCEGITPKVDPCDTLTSVSNKSLLLSSLNVYPNPYQNFATIEYQISKTSQVGIEITDLSGRRVWSQKPESTPTGTHQVLLNSEMIPQKGIYFVRIQVGDEFWVRKLIHY